MKFIPKNIKKFLLGGLMAPEEDPTMQAPETEPTEGGQDPLMMLVEAANQALQTQDANLAFQVCQGLVELVSLMSGAAPLGEPVFAKNGAKLIRRIPR